MLHLLSSLWFLTVALMGCGPGVAEGEGEPEGDGEGDGEPEEEGEGDAAEGEGEEGDEGEGDSSEGEGEAAIVDIGEPCAINGDVCDLGSIDRTNDGIPDRISCIDNSCTLVEAIAANNPCNPTAIDSECDPRTESLQCLSVVDPEDLRCVTPVELNPSEACIPNTTAAVCSDGYACDADLGCILPSQASCLLAEPLDGLDSLVPVGPGAPLVMNTTSCSTATSYAIRSYQPNQAVVLDIATDGFIATTADCNDNRYACSNANTNSQVVADADDPVYLFIAATSEQEFSPSGGPFGEFIEVRIEETPIAILSEDESCALFDPLQRCESGLVCTLGRCDVAPSLSLDAVDQPQALAVSDGDQQCFLLDLPDGRYRFVTAGECSNQNDLTFVSVELTQNGRRTLGTDIDNNTFCQELIATIEAEDDNVLCVATLEELGPIAGVTLTIEAQ